jgi:hypothetical protein
MEASDYEKLLKQLKTNLIFTTKKNCSTSSIMMRVEKWYPRNISSMPQSLLMLLGRYMLEPCTA